MIAADALKYVPQMGLDRLGVAVRQQSVKTLSPWRMNWPSEQSLERKSPSLRLAATRVEASRANSGRAIFDKTGPIKAIPIKSFPVG
jgi:hypothetical protein